MTRILLAEDEPVLARNIAQPLRMTGEQVPHAPSASASRQASNHEAFKLLEAQNSLGDSNGFEVIGEARTRLQKTPASGMTGQDSVDHRACAGRRLVVAFLSKSSALPKMLGSVGSLTRGQEFDHAHKLSSVLIHSRGTIGLGHIWRTAAIDRKLAERPSHSKSGRGVFQAGSPRLDAETMRDIGDRIVEGILATIEPGVFPVDQESTGAKEESGPAQRRLKDSHARTVLGLRDILDAPERMRAAWMAAGIARLVSETYDHVLVDGDPGFFTNRDVYDLETLKPGPVTETGVVTTVRPTPRHQPLVAQRRIVVFGGRRAGRISVDRSRICGSQRDTRSPSSCDCRHHRCVDGPGVAPRCAQVG